MIGLIGLLIALGALIFLVSHKISVLIHGPTIALIATVFSGFIRLASYTQILMPSLGHVVIHCFSFLLLSAVFGRLVDKSRFTNNIAEGRITKLGPEKAISRQWWRRSSLMWQTLS